MRTLLFVCCALANTIHSYESGQMKCFELVVKKQFKIKRVEFMKKENTNPFFVKKVPLPRQRYYTSDGTGELKEIDEKKISLYTDLTTVVNLEINTNDLKYLTNCFFFLLCKHGSSFNFGFFEVDDNHNLNITEGPYWITEDEIVLLNVVDHHIQLKNNVDDDERKHWSTHEIVMFICLSVICGVAVCALCYWFSKGMSDANR